ncbi:MAG: hypothetical protein J3Q66DRAFT_208895 [Benniella sp.]|nr:MAG: hypothetical protein J3Q66DRAFT_208895 [Benniella sp.]
MASCALSVDIAVLKPSKEHCTITLADYCPRTLFLLDRVGSSRPLMATRAYLDWVLRKEPQKEHVSFKNFVIKFGFTDKASAHEAYLSLINSKQLREKRRAKLREAYKTFQERSEHGFWANRALKTADQMLLVTGATVAKKAGAMIQKVGLQEANSGLKRYPSELSNVESLEVIDDSDDDESEADEEVGSPVKELVASSSTTAAMSSSTSSSLDISTGKKHPRDTFDVDYTDPRKTPRNRSPLPIPIPTESLDSPSTVSASTNLKDPFQNDDNEDEEEEGTDDEAVEDNDILLPDANEYELQFSATLEGTDIATGFQQLFRVVKKKKVYIKDTDEALARSGIILLEKEETELQRRCFGKETLAQIREKALAKWLDIDATACRSQVRAWLDPHEDNGYNREKSHKHISENAPSGGGYRKLWSYLITAIEEFPEFDGSKEYSESAGISSFILPLCRAFMSIPHKRVFLNFVDSTTSSGRSCGSRKEPDMALEIKDKTNKTICEVGIGEVTSHEQKGHWKKNAKDLVRIGLSLKDALDWMQDNYDVEDAVLVGWQVIGQDMAIYHVPVWQSLSHGACSRCQYSRQPHGACINPIADQDLE